MISRDDFDAGPVGDVMAESAATDQQFAAAITSQAPAAPDPNIAFARDRDFASAVNPASQFAGGIPDEQQAFQLDTGERARNARLGLESWQYEPPEDIPYDLDKDREVFGGAPPGSLRGSPPRELVGDPGFQADSGERARAERMGLEGWHADRGPFLPDVELDTSQVLDLRGTDPFVERDRDWRRGDGAAASRLFDMATGRETVDEGEDARDRRLARAQAAKEAPRDQTEEELRSEKVPLEDIYGDRRRRVGSGGARITEPGSEPEYPPEGKVWVGDDGEPMLDEEGNPAPLPARAPRSVYASAFPDAAASADVFDPSKQPSRQADPIASYRRGERDLPVESFGERLLGSALSELRETPIIGGLSRPVGDVLGQVGEAFETSAKITQGLLGIGVAVGDEAAQRRLVGMLQQGAARTGLDIRDPRLRIAVARELWEEQTKGLEIKPNTGKARSPLQQRLEENLAGANPIKGFGELIADPTNIIDPGFAKETLTILGLALGGVRKVGSGRAGREVGEELAARIKSMAASPMESPESIAHKLRKELAPVIAARGQSAEPSALRALVDDVLNGPTPVKREVRLHPGKETVAVTESGAEVPLRYSVVEADDLVTSNNPDFTPNLDYPGDLQPRDRSRFASQQQVNDIAAKLDPERLGANRLISEGAPVVRGDGVVVSGNGRVMAIRAAAEDRVELLRDFILRNAEEYGVDPAAVQGMKRPVLVRVGDEGTDWAAVAREANAPTVAGYSATEQAIDDATRLTDALLDELQGDDLLAGGNAEFRRRFMGEVLTGAAERMRYVTADGQSFTQDAVTRMRNAVFQRAYGDSEALARMAESTDDNVKNVTKAMVAAAPRIAKMREAIRQGQAFGLDVSGDIAAAMRTFARLREQGMSVKDFMAQGFLFAESNDLSQTGRSFLVFMDRNSRAPRRITDALTEYADSVLQAGDPRQAGLFGPVERPDLESVLGKVGADTPQAGFSAADDVVGPPKAIGSQIVAQELGPDVTKLAEGFPSAGKPGALERIEVPAGEMLEHPQTSFALRDDQGAKTETSRAEILARAKASATAQAKRTMAEPKSLQSKLAASMGSPVPDIQVAAEVLLTGRGPFTPGRLTAIEELRGKPPEVKAAFHVKQGTDAPPNAAGIGDQTDIDFQFEADQLAGRGLGGPHQARGPLTISRLDDGPGGIRRWEIPLAGHTDAEVEAIRDALARSRGFTVEQGTRNAAALEVTAHPDDFRASVVSLADADDFARFLHPDQTPNVQAIGDALLRGEELPTQITRSPKVARALASELPATMLKGGTPGPAGLSPEQLIERRTTGKDKLIEEARKLTRKLSGGTPRKDKRLDIVMGYPGAGKNAIVADDLIKKHRSLLVDADDGKKTLAEFRGGLGANAVHEESSAIFDAALDELSREGFNIVAPLVGANPERVLETIARYRKLGWRVEVHYVNITHAQSKERAIERFLATGRWIGEEYLDRIAGLPEMTYNRVRELTRKEGGPHAAHYFDNSGERGAHRYVPEHSVAEPDADGIAAGAPDGARGRDGAGSAADLGRTPAAAGGAATAAPARVGPPPSVAVAAPPPATVAPAAPAAAPAGSTGSAGRRPPPPPTPDQQDALAEGKALDWWIERGGVKPDELTIANANARIASGELSDTWLRSLDLARAGRYAGDDEAQFAARKLLERAANTHTAALAAGDPDRLSRAFVRMMEADMGQRLLLAQSGRGQRAIQIPLGGQAAKGAKQAPTGVATVNVARRGRAPLTLTPEEIATALRSTEIVELPTGESISDTLRRAFGDLRELGVNIRALQSAMPTDAAGMDTFRKGLLRVLEDVAHKRLLADEVTTEFVKPGVFTNPFRRVKAGEQQETNLIQDLFRDVMRTTLLFPKAVVKNVLGNSVKWTSKIPEAVLTAGLETLAARAVPGYQQGMYFRDILPAYKASVGGFAYGFKNGAAAILRSGPGAEDLAIIDNIPSRIDLLMDSANYGKVGRAVGLVLHAATLGQAGSRLSIAGDVIQKYAYHSEYLMFRAQREASERGLRGAAADAYAASMLEAPRGKWLYEAKKYADKETFNASDSEFARDLIKWRGRLPIIGDLLMPFVNTNVNIAKESFARTPLGLTTLAGKTGLEQSRTIARAMVGTATLGGLMFYVASDNITGRGPSERKAKDQWLEDHEEYSFRLPGPDGGYWVSYAWLAPVLGPLMWAADAHDAVVHDNKKLSLDEVVVAAFGFANSVWEQQGYFEGMRDFYDAISETFERGNGESLKRWMADRLFQATPLGPEARIGSSVRDTHYRDAKGGSVWDYYRANIPGLNEDLPFGRERRRSGAGALLPVNVREYQRQHSNPPVSGPATPTPQPGAAPSAAPANDVKTSWGR